MEPTALVFFHLSSSFSSLSFCFRFEAFLFFQIFISNDLISHQLACGCGVGDAGSGVCNSLGICTCRSNFGDNKCTTCALGYYLSGSSCIGKYSFPLRSFLYFAKKKSYSTLES